MDFQVADAPRILILRRDNIGDLACTTPLIAALRARWPRAWLGALVTTYNAEVLAGNPHLDAVIAYEKLKHRRGGLWSFARERLAQSAELRRKKLDVVLVPAPGEQALKMARRLRPSQVLASPLSFAEGRHEVERTFDLGRELGLGGQPGPMQVVPDTVAVAELRARLGDAPVIGLHISARRPKQHWPLDRYAALARALSQRARVLLLWAPGAKDDPRHPGDDEAARQVLAGASNAIVPMPTPDLRTLIAALAACRLVVCPDGGAMHLAAALGKPVVALFGDSPVARWRPWVVPHRVVQPASRDLADLALEAVISAWRELE
jgi:heptosyltransferase III